MISKNEIKFLRSLHQNKYRRRLGLFLAEGSINVLDYLQGPLQVEKLFAGQDWLEANKHQLSRVDWHEVSRKEMEKITALKNPSEVLAVVKKPEYLLPEISSLDGYVLAMDGLRDPGNLGTIIRTADWFGIQDIVCSPETVDAFNPKVVQATMGSLARVRVHYTDLAAYFETKPSGLNVFGAVLDGDDIRKAAKPGKGILLIGSEAHGISETLYPFINHRIRIPSAETSGAESLNAAVATALVCYAFMEK
jgi:TrmH family RNA methyltransferase